MLRGSGQNLRMGRKAAGNRGQGHFQDRARQLTSPAFGRASLQGPACAGRPRSPSRNTRCARRAVFTESLRPAASEMGMRTLLMLLPEHPVLTGVVLTLVL